MNDPVGTLCKFNYPTVFVTLPEYSARRGHAMVVTRQLREDEADRGEGLERMFEVLGADGFIGHAFESELEEVAVGVTCGSNGRYRYGLAYRPAGIGTVPKGFIALEPAGTSEKAVARHGVVVYQEPLSEDELLAFELVLLSDELGDQAAAHAVARGLGKYGTRYAALYLEQRDMVEEAIARALKKLFKFKILLKDQGGFAEKVIKVIRGGEVSN